MKVVRTIACPIVLMAAALFYVSAVSSARAAGEVVIYSTGFESSEGYDDTRDLAGQKGWVYAGAGGNGLVTNVFSSSDQQAYVGFDPAPGTNDFLYVWQPIDLDPVPPSTPVIQFTVKMAIADSTSGEWDNFSWEVFNSQGDSLVTIDFDNFYTRVRYALSGDLEFTETEVFFTNNIIYDFTLTLDFENNVWSAMLDDAVIAKGLRISKGDPLNFGDVSMLWFNAAGFQLNDNYIVFDDYKITAYPKPNVDWLGFTTGGGARIRLFGETGNTYVIEAGNTVKDWMPVYTNLLTGAFFDYTNANALPVTQRFFRSRLLQ